MALSIVDQGDGTVAVSDPGNPTFSVTDQGDGTMLVAGAAASDQGDGTTLIAPPIGVAMVGAGTMGVSPAAARTASVTMVGQGALGVTPGGSAAVTGTVAMAGSGRVDVVARVGPLIVATPQPDQTPPRVRLDMFGFRGATVRVERVDLGGGRNTVRTADPAPLAGFGAVRYDYFAQFNRPASYSATSDTGSTAQSDQVTLAVDRSWLIHPLVPSLSQPVTVHRRAQRTRTTNRGLFAPIGRSTPIARGDGSRQAPSYELTVMTYGEQAEASLLALLGDSSALLFQNTLGGTRGLYEWISVGDLTDDDLTEGLPDDPYLMWALPVTVVDEPAGTQQSQWTLGGIKAAYDSLGGVRANYASLRDLATNTLIDS